MLKKILFVVILLIAMNSTLVYAAPADQPKSGQTKCYDAAGTLISCATTTGQGQDGALQDGVDWPGTRFTVASSGTGTVVSDNLTGLMWPQDGSTPTLSTLCTGGTKTWQPALDYVACLNKYKYLGYTDWRLPNVNELESLVNAGYNEVICAAPSTYCATNADWLNTQGFSNVQADCYWSSTTFAGSTIGAWYVNMGDGYVDGLTKSIFTFDVWPVRSGQ